MANQLIIQSSGIVLDTGEYDYDLSVIQFQYSGIITTGENKPDSDTQHAITIVCDDYIGAFEMSHQDILTLATTLISQSEFALTANMKFNALIHEKRRFKKLRQKYDVNEIIIKCVDHEPYNYGPGFKEFNISLSYDMTDGYIPKYPHDRNFSYNEVLYFSKLENDFEKDILSITGGSIPYRFVNYDHDDEVIIFNENLMNYDTNATYTTCGDVSNAPIYDEYVTRLATLATDIQHANMSECYNSQSSNVPIDLSSASIDSSIDPSINRIDSVVKNIADNISHDMLSLYNRINSGDTDI